MDDRDRRTSSEKALHTAHMVGALDELAALEQAAAGAKRPRGEPKITASAIRAGVVTMVVTDP